MKNPINILRNTFGNKRTNNNNQAEKQTATIINEIEETPFAVSNSNVMYSAVGELGGYYFMQTIIIGDFHVKTLTGAQLECIGYDFKISLESDTTELKSDYSNTSNRSMTRIDFQIEKDDVLKIEKSKLKTVILNCKKTSIQFIIYKEDIS